MSTKAARHPLAYEAARVAILGASGFIGRWVALALTARRADLSLVVRDAARAEPLFAPLGVRGTIIEADLRDRTAVVALMNDLKPSITFNLAGYGVDPTETDPRAADQINVGLVEALCDGLARLQDREWRGHHLVHVGSALEYGTARGDLREDSIPEPTTLYGKSKLAGTQAVTERCRRNGFRGLTARLFTVYGPGEHAHRLLPSIMALAADPRQELSLTAGHQKRDFTYVRDVADGLLRLGLTDAEPGAVVNLATGILTPVREVALIAAVLLAIAPDRLHFGALSVREEEMSHDPVNVTRLRALTGWSPGTIPQDGVRETLRHAGLPREMPSAPSGL